jgi:hypothetical protein
MHYASGQEDAWIWEAESGRQIGSFSGGGPINSVAFSSDGRRLVTASFFNTMSIWDAESRKKISVWRSGGEVHTAMFSPDNRRVLAASGSTANIWDVESGRIAGVLSGHQNEQVLSAAFSPDGRHVVTTSRDKTAWIWQVFPTTQDLVDEAKRQVPRCLTHEQRESAFLELEPPAWCIEMAKWPYESQDWRDWLRFKRENANPPLPDSWVDWNNWLTAHQR